MTTFKSKWENFSPTKKVFETSQSVTSKTSESPVTFLQMPENETSKGSESLLIPPSAGFAGSGVARFEKVASDAEQTIMRLPWQLERLVQAASSGVLNISLHGVGDVTRYVMAWACSYLTADKDEALKRLWEVYSLWQPNN